MLYYKKAHIGNPYSTLERWFDFLYPFLEKGVLFWMILISVASTIDTIHPLPVISLLLALMISALAQAFPKKRLSSVCLGGYFLLCSCYPPILLTMPLLLYDAIRAKKMVSLALRRRCITASCYIFFAANLFILRTDSAFDCIGLADSTMGNLGTDCPPAA